MKKFMQFMCEVAVLLLATLTSVVILTNVLFLFHVSITRWHLPLVFLLTASIYVLCNYRHISKAILGVGTALIVLVGAICVCGRFYDSTTLGNTDYKVAVGMMKNGWNPVYDEVKEFGVKNGNPFEISAENIEPTWADTYARAPEVFEATVYAFTKNIETAKCFNVLFVFCGFFILWHILVQMGVGGIKSAVLAAILAFNPISMVQLANFYVDGALAISVFMMILLAALSCSGRMKKEDYLVLAMAIIWCIGISFSGLVYAAAFCGVLFIYRHIYSLIRDKKNFGKFLGQELLFYIAVVVIGVGVVGSGPFVRSMIKFGNPVHDLGASVRAEMEEVPESMRSYDLLRTFSVSFLSKGGSDPAPKIPFAVTRAEINNYSVPDVRMAGFGPWFSGIFILALIGTLCVIIRMLVKRDAKALVPYVLILATTVVLAFFSPGNYAARYIPFVFLVPIYILIYCWQRKSNFVVEGLSWVMAVLLIANVSMIMYAQLKSTISQNEAIDVRKERFLDNVAITKRRGGVTRIQLKDPEHQGVLYNIEDWGVGKYELVEDGLNTDIYMFKY